MNRIDSRIVVSYLFKVTTLLKCLRSDHLTRHTNLYLIYYAYYLRSPKNCRLLHAVSEELSEQFRKIGKVFDVRWLPISSAEYASAASRV